MLVVTQHLKCLLENLHEVAFVEESCSRRFRCEQNSQCMHGFKPDFHKFWFNVLHRENNCQDQSVELSRIQLEASLGAMLDDVFDEHEERVTELRVSRSIILDHVQSAFTK